ncbi:hypothetical protein [Amycolatopsis jejuensis]|uniref:linalool dehydratase/isomerase domain-containing protein n=1 Tax=Amycolatopsis jejuensis TaxID=330084 RepID=UPI000524A884|nr:hypothetical protein [Amycolatopsis jejuensis]
MSEIIPQTGPWWKGKVFDTFEPRPGSGGPFRGRVRSLSEVVPGVPALTDEAIGWLAHLHRKVGFGGTWAKTDVPHESWDDRSFTPSGNFARYDFSWNMWSLASMAQATPAWREVYGEVLGFMSDRYLEYWALYEWLEYQGDDPNRENYPPEWQAWIPPGLAGKYNMTGWAGNGSGGFEFDPDPVRGGGQNLMYKGYLDFALSLYGYVTGDDKYDRPFDVVYDEDHRFRYDHRELNELIARQWRESWPGIACEAGKIFPLCNLLTGTAVRLFDVMHGTTLLTPFHNWNRYARRHYHPVDADTGRITTTTSIYDPVVDVTMNEPGQQSAGIYASMAWHAIGLDRPTAERMYDGMIHQFFCEQKDGTAFLSPVAGMEIDSNAATGLGAACALELGDLETYSALRGWMENNYEPTWDDEHGEFSLGFGLSERWPRGQYNGWVMPAFTLSNPGDWRDLHVNPNTAKFLEPTLEGVDYPTVRVRQAYYTATNRTLNVSVTSADRHALGRPTSLTVSNLIDQATYQVLLDGKQVDGAAPRGGRIEVTTTVGPHTLIVRQV